MKVRKRIKRKPIRVIVGYRTMLAYDGHARFTGKYMKPILKWRLKHDPAIINGRQVRHD